MQTERKGAFNFGRALQGVVEPVPALGRLDDGPPPLQPLVDAAEALHDHRQSGELQDEPAPSPPPVLSVDRPCEAPVATEVSPNSMSLHWGHSSVTVQARELRVVNYMLQYELSMQQLEGDSSSTMQPVDKPDKWIVQYLGPAIYVQVKGLRPGRRYAVRVACKPQVDDPAVVVELAAPSPLAVICTPPTPPGPLRVPALSGRQKRQLTYKWAEPEETGGRPIQEYQLQMAPPPEGWQGPPAPEGDGFYEVYRGRERRCAAQPLQPGVRYSARVRAVSSEGAGPWSPVCNYYTSAGVPAAPAYLALADASEDSITLQWEAPSDGGSEISSYELEMDSGRGGEFALVQRVPPGQTRHTVVGLVPGTSYRLRVRAESSAGKGAWSPVAEVQTAAAAPGPPSAPSKLGCNQTSISITWQEPESTGGSPVEGYEVEMRPKCRGAMRGMEDAWVRVYEGSARTCTLGGLRAGCTFRARIRAFNSAGVGDYCMPVDLATSPDVPDAPAAPSASARHQTSVLLAWGPPEHDGGSSIVSYRLEARCLGRVEQLQLAAAQAAPAFEGVYLGPERCCELRGLEPGTRHELRLSAINSQGASPWSPLLTVDTRPGLPCAPDSCEVAAVASTSLQLRWAPPYGQGSPVNSYVLQMCTQQVLQQAQLASVACAVAPAEQQQQQQKGAPAAAEAGQAVPAALPPGAPVPASAAAAPEMNNTATSAAAAAPQMNGTAAIANGHHHAAAERQGSTTPTTASDAGSSLHAADAFDAIFSTLYHGGDSCYTAKVLQPDCQYAFRLRAHNSVGASAWAPVLMARTAPAAPSAPTCLTLSELPTSTSVSLAWQPPAQEFGAPVSGYQVEWAAVPRASRASPTWHPAYTGPATSCKVEGLRPGQQVQLRVRAANTCGWGAWAEPIAATAAPDVPGPPEPPSSSNRTATAVRLRWAPSAEDNGAAVVRYVVQLAPAAACHDDSAYQVAYCGESPACKLQQLSPGTEYACRVAAVNAVGQGPASAPALFSTALAPPLPPTCIQAALLDTESGPASVSVSWASVQAPLAAAESYTAQQLEQPRAACIGFEVEAAPQPGEGSSSAAKPVSKTCSARVTQMTLGPLPPGVYAVHVRSVGADGAGHGEWSRSATVTVEQQALAAPSSAGSDGEAGPAALHQRRRSRGSKAPLSEEEQAAAGDTDGSAGSKRRRRPRSRSWLARLAGSPTGQTLLAAMLLGLVAVSLYHLVSLNPRAWALGAGALASVVALGALPRLLLSAAQRMAVSAPAGLEADGRKHSRVIVGTAVSAITALVTVAAFFLISCRKPRGWLLRNWSVMLLTVAATVCVANFALIGIRYMHDREQRMAKNVPSSKNQDKQRRKRK